jgi:hypothetical protein
LNHVKTFRAMWQQYWKDFQKMTSGHISSHVRDAGMYVWSQKANTLNVTSLSKGWWQYIHILFYRINPAICQTMYMEETAILAAWKLHLIVQDIAHDLISYVLQCN